MTDPFCNRLPSSFSITKPETWSPNAHASDLRWIAGSAVVLGVWLFDHSPQYRATYGRIHLNNKNPSFISGEFTFQWLFAGLMHDIGYLFENITGDTLPYRKAIDHLFRPDYLVSLRRHFPYCKTATLKVVQQILKDKILRWRNSGLMPSYAKVDSAAGVLSELRKCPWTQEMIADCSGTTSALFSLATAAIRRISHSSAIRNIGAIDQYADKVAVSGYVPGSRPTVDHGYASGYLLLQLTSLRYWIVHETSIHNRDVAEELEASGAKGRGPGFSYDVNNLIKVVAPACHAAACHNIQAIVESTHALLPFPLKRNPLLFFSVLCDELQQWHRSPVGREHTKAPFHFVPSDPTRVFLRVDGEGRAGFGCTDERLAQSIVTAVRKRLCTESLADFFHFSDEAGKAATEAKISYLLGI